MSETNSENDKQIVTENWIKPPKLVTYKTSKLITQGSDTLVCEFLFPQKYYQKDFYLFGEKVLSKGDLYRGRRTFFADRFYSLLEYYSDTGELKAYYFDIILPPVLTENAALLLDIKLDFFVLADRKTFYLLDEDELDEAVRNDLFTKDEIEVCMRTTEFIRSALYKDKFESIFTDYEKTSYKEWARYNEYIK